MNIAEREIVRDAADRICRALADVIMPTTTLSLILHETTRLTLLTYDLTSQPTTERTPTNVEEF